MRPGIKLHLRGALDGAAPAIGPGKVALLEAIARTGSISSAARALGMSYRRAWLLVDETNRCLVRPAVLAASGGTRGGGAALTPAGEELVRRYRKLERRIGVLADRELAPLLRPVRGVRPGSDPGPGLVARPSAPAAPTRRNPRR